MPNGYSIGWEAGASAQIEIFSPELDTATAGPDYRLKFSPPMRKTIRPPMRELQLGDGQLGPIIDKLNSLSATIDARALRTGHLLRQASQRPGLLLLTRRKRRAIFCSPSLFPTTCKLSWLLTISFLRSVWMKRSSNFPGNYCMTELNSFV